MSDSGNSSNGSDDSGRKTVAVIGASFAGLSAIRRLLKDKKSLRHMILISDSSHFIYTPSLWILHRIPLIEDKITINLREFCQDNHIEFVHDTVEHIDPAKKTVICSRQHISCDYLLVCAGSKVNYFGIPGLQDNSLVLKKLGDAYILREKLTNLIEVQQDKQQDKQQDIRQDAGQDISKDTLKDVAVATQKDASKDAQKESGLERIAMQKQENLLRIVVGGGGLTGVETAIGISLFLRSVLKKRMTSFPFEICIIEGSSSILSGFPKKAILKTKKYLAAHGIVLREGVMIRSVSARQVMDAKRYSLELSDGALLPAALVVWSGGVKPADCFADSGLELSERASIKVDGYLRCTGHQDIFAAGDNTFIIDPSTGKPLPMTAHWAMEEGKAAGKNILIQNRNSHMIPFEPHDKIRSLIGLGTYEGILVWGNFVLSGWIPALMKRMMQYYVMRRLR